MEAEAIISKAEGCNVAGLYRELRSYLEPLNGLLGFEGPKKGHEYTVQIHGFAKRYVPFLARLLKVSCNNLIQGISTSETEQKRADELFMTLKLVLDCFDALRPCLVGNPHEIEVQRHWMVRRLMAWKRFIEAREGCWVTLHSLKVNIFCKDVKGKKEVVASARKRSVKKDVTTSSTRKKDVGASVRKTKEKENENYGVDLYGEFAEAADSGLVELVLGLVTDLIICTGESKLKEADEYRKILVLTEQLVPWQRISDKNTIEKHRSMLFKGLHKCVLFMISEPSYFDPMLTRTFVLLALDNCASSSVKDQFVKVTCGICRQLVSRWPDHSSIVVDICKLTLSTIFKGLQRQIYGENEIIDVVEFYCHHCETSFKLTKDAKQFLHAIANTCGQGLPFHLPAALHIYGVGMRFKGFEVSSLGNDGVDYIDSKISEVQSCAENDDNELLSNLVQMFQSMVEEFQKSSGDSEYGKNGYEVASCGIKSNAALSNHDNIWTGRSLICIFKALEFLSKASAECVKQEWDSFVANATKCRPSAWFSSLEQAFLIFSRVFLAVLGCNVIPLEEKKELRRGHQTVLLAATAALKLALMCQKHSQESFEIIETLTSGGFVQVQEIKWLSNCTYNIGVRMFNIKRFDLASNPLKLAYTAAWRRISCVMNGSLDDCVESEYGTSSSESISELVSDACAKSVVLVDVLHRSGSPLAKEMITDFLTQWSSADSRLSSMNSRRALVKHWVKIVSEDSKDMELNEASVDCPTLYEVLTDRSSTWPVETLGVLLEEELLAYAHIETELSRLKQKRIIKLLLEDVYVTKEFSLERSRVLLEQCKAARLIGAYGLDKCMDCLSDAMLLLKKELDENLCPSGQSYHMDCRHQLAITYCVHAFCIQELKLDSKVILDDISSALKLWSCIYSSELLELNKEQKDWLFDTSVPLLLNVSQLLALKGFISLQSEVQEMILQILSALKKISPEECCALLWRESRLNHTLCCIPVSANIFSTLIGKVGNAINSLSFWEKSLNDHPGSLLEFQQKLTCDLFIEVQAHRDFSTDSFLRSLNTNSIELLKDRVLTLAPNVQKSIQFSFATSNLFYILSEKCRTNGKLAEAVKYSKEALLIRRKQLQRSFKFVEKEVQLAFNNEIKGFSLEAQGSVATNVWSNYFVNGKQEYGTSQWIVLGNYLESLMQVGILYEMVGAANEAEYVFQEGLYISNAQDLPLSQAAFGSSLGEIYRKCHKWEIAKNKFQEAMKVLGRPDVEHMCKLCKVTIEATLEMRIGDFVRRCPRESKAAHFYKEMTSAFDIYMLAKEKLNYVERKYSDDMPLDRKMHTECCHSNSRASKEGNAASSPELESDPTLYSGRNCNITDSVQELMAFTFELHRRSLMSRLMLQIGKCHETSGEFLKAHEIMLQNSSLLFLFIDGLPCLCSFVNGHHCQQKCPGWKFPVDILLFERAALLYHISWFALKKNLPTLSWTQCCSSSENRRSFVIGWLQHAFFICNQMPALLRKVSILLAIVHMPLALGGLFSVPEDYISNLSGSHWSAYFHQASLGTTLREEHLAVLDAKLASQDSDNQASQHNNSRDVIERVQQVLRLTPDKLDCLETFVTNFFQSVPLPTIVCISFLDCRYASILEESSFSDCSSAWIFLTRFDSDGPPVVLLLPIHSTFNGRRTDAVEGSNLCSPHTIWNLEADDLKGNDISSSSKVMDVVAEEFHLLLEESCLSTSAALPVASNEEKTRWWQWRKQLDNRLGNLLRGIEDSWLGPWKCLLLGKPSEAAYCNALQTHIQDLKSRVYSVALNIGKEDYFPVDTGLLEALLYGISSLTNNEIEKCICCLLLKETMHGSILSHSIHEGSARQDIVGKAAKELTSIFQHAASRKNYCNIQDNEPRKSSRKQKKQLREEDSTECTSSESFLPCNLSNNLENSSMMCIPREPVVLVLDANSQVLPWESLPVLRNQEVYRMPSVGSISAVMISRGYVPMVYSSDEKEKKMSKRKTNTKQAILARKNPQSVALEQLPKLPVMDPYNAFYLLNPSGDLSTTQAAFEDWFKNQCGWKGKSGEVPTPEECIFALQKHDLFIYFGHGRGEQYMPERNIRRLDYCATVVLMGCSSGRLSYRGDYEPVGVPLSYLIAGCPCIIANLWDVTDGDIDRFSRVLLHSWLEAKSSQCNDLDVFEEFQNLSVSDENNVKRALRPRQKLKDDKTKCLQFQQLLPENVNDKSITTKSTRDEVRTGSCIGKCRGTCKLPYLVGASPVCYGIPTIIKHK